MTLPKNRIDREYNKFTETNDGKTAIRTISLGSLVNVEYDTFDTTYYTSGNGDGQIETVTYKLSGSPVLTVTMTYDTSGRLSNVSSL